MTVLLALLLAAAPLATGDGFTVPVPNGFRVATGADAQGLIRSGGVQLVEQDFPAGKQAYLANIIIGPVRMASFDPEDPAACASAASQMAMWIGGTVKKSGIVALRWGRTCQLEVEGSRDNPHRAGRATVLRDGARKWMITCNYDARDAAAQEACGAVLASVKAAPGAHAEPRPDAEGARASERARGAGYSIVVPQPFRAMPRGAVPGNPQASAVLERGGLILVEEARPTVDDPFLGSIVISPVTEDAGPERCPAIASGLASGTGSALKRQGLVEMPWGKSCQIDLEGQANRGGRATVMKAGAKTWMVTCNFDVRDKPARDGCDAVLASVVPDEGAAAQEKFDARVTCEKMAAAGELKKGVSVEQCMERLAQ